MLTAYLDRIVGRFFASVNKESITLISIPIVIWAALALLSTIERAFNNIWRVGRGRNFLQRMINYWALLTLGPLLLGVGIYISTQYSTVGQIHKTILSNVAPALLSYLVSTAAFFFLYFVLPNTKVQARAAIWGAAVAALVWSFAKWGFAQYVTEFIPYSKVYGVVGLVPLGVFWIFITWLIVLFGLQLTFTTQKILDHLVKARLLIKTSEPKVGFILAKDATNVKLSDIAAAVAEVGFAQSTTDQPATLERIAQSQRSVLGQYSLKQILKDEQSG